jgi:hypothetical protein
MVNPMRKLHEIAKPGEGLRPELRSLYERLAKDPHSEQFVRSDGMVQSGPDPDRETRPPAKRKTALKIDACDATGCPAIDATDGRERVDSPRQKSSV